MIVSSETATLIGSVAAVCTTGAFVPQVVRVWRMRSAAAISLATFSVFAFGTFVWLLYGWFINSWPVIVANAVTFALAISIVLLKLKYDRAARRAPADRTGRG
ncbi:MAG TPA: SemiSWEET transporter [Thermoplasmata archaeon]|jgi:MtN3 and saliva related transmembrane protein|nr:SemiSWEET transporter [Thermoplasmata archaeon]